MSHQKKEEKKKSTLPDYTFAFVDSFILQLYPGVYVNQACKKMEKG